MSLTQLLEAFSRQRSLFFVVLIAALIGSVLYTLSLPTLYSTTATLFVGENRPITTGATAVQLDEVLARTYAELLDTATVRAKAVEALPFKSTAQQVDDSVGFEVLTGTRLIEITAEDPSPTRAAEIANTYADTFVIHQRTSAADASRERLEALNAKIRALVLEIQGLQARSGGEAAADLERAETELAAARESYSATEQNTSLQDSNVSVSTQASVPASPAKPRTKLILAIAAIVSLFLALAAALLRDKFDRRVRDEEELVELLGVPVLARIPTRRRSEVRVRAFTEALELLRTNLMLSDTAGARTMAITSALPGDGKTTVLKGLSEAFARAGETVVAVDCDLRRPMLATAFETEGGRGVSNVLASPTAVKDVLRPTSVVGVRVLPAGPLPPNPSALLGKDQVAKLVDELRDEADFVLVDTPPVAAGAETSTIASEVDATVLVVDFRTSRRDGLAAAREQLDRTGAKLVGIVVNRSAESGMGYPYYYYYAPGSDKSSSTSEDRQVDDALAPEPAKR